MRGPYFDDLTVGETFTSRRRTITEADVVLFANLAGLLSPLFHDHDFARQHDFAAPLCPGPLTFSYSVGLTEDLTHGTVLAALRFDELVFHRPVYVGDTIHVVSTVRSAKASRTRPGTGVVAMHHAVNNQDGALAADYVRTMLYGTRAHLEGSES